MKKMISVFLCIVMLLTSVVGLNVSAAENQEIDKKASLYWLYYACYWNFQSVGGVDIHGNVSKSDMNEVLENTEAVLENKNATAADYENAYDNLMYQAYNMTVDPAIAYDTYLNSLKEENYNNWYSEEDWKSFVIKRDEFKVVFDRYYGLDEYGRVECKVPSTHEKTAEYTLSDAFYALLKSYNVMTNRYTLMGDVNKDGHVNIQDVTLIQKSLVELDNLTGAQKILTGDYNYENPTIMTATNLQKYIVEDNGADMSDINLIPEKGFHDSYERRMERTFNFCICSRIPVTYPTAIANGYYDTNYLENYYNRYSK